MASIATTALQSPNPLQEKGNLANNWTIFRQNFSIYVTALGIEDDSKACALLLHTIGQFGRDIYNKLEINNEESLDILYDKFEQYCKPKNNLVCNRVQFFNTRQGKKQKFDDFVSGLKYRAKECKFGELTDSLLMTQVISGLSNFKLKERLLTMPDLTLDDTIRECRSCELAQLHIKELTAASQPQNPQPAFKKNPTPKQNALPKQKPRFKNNTSTNEFVVINNPLGKSEVTLGKEAVIKCKFCNNEHLYGKCPNFKNVSNPKLTKKINK